jgi:hypothetical protein
VSDEFEDISVVETEPVEVASVEPAMIATPDNAPASEPVSAVDKPSAMEEATFLNTDPADNIEDNNQKQIFSETFGPDLASGGPTLTAKAIAEKEAAKLEKQAEGYERSQDEIKRAEAHQEFMNKEHDFGDMKMSGADLSKLIDFYNNNPQMLDKLKDKMVKSGMSKDKADKVAKDFDETMKLQKKERDEGLTPDEKQRLAQLNKDKDVAYAAKVFTNLAVESGVELTLNKNQTFKTAQSSGSMIERSQAEEETIKANHVNSKASIAVATSDFEEMSSASLAKAHFASAPDLKDEFSSSANKKLVASNDIGANFAADTPTVVVAQAQVKTKVPVLDTSFG